MFNFMTIGNEVVNLGHVVKAQYWPAEPEGKAFYDEDSNEMRTPPAREARLQITLTSVHLGTETEGESGNLAAASVSDKMMVRGEFAEIAWLLLSGEVEPEK